MDRDSVIKMAKESGMDDWTNDGNWNSVDDDLIRFANLVRNHALDEAAKECESIALDVYGMINTREYSECANAIRAMKVGADKTAGDK